MCEVALSEHLKRRLDAPRGIQATERDEHLPRKALQATGEDPRAAIGAEVPIARLRDVMKCFCLAAGQREIILRDAEECGRLAAKAVADGDKSRIDTAGGGSASL